MRKYAFLIGDRITSYYTRPSGPLTFVVILRANRRGGRRIWEQVNHPESHGSTKSAIDFAERSASFSGWPLVPGYKHGDSVPTVEEFTVELLKHG